MANVERTGSASSLIDVLDRVLDKGIVIDAWVRLSLVGIDLLTLEARVVVASIDTYLKYSEAVSQVAPVSKPVFTAPREPVAVPMPAPMDLPLGASRRAPRRR
jgi:gas vesicle structural protein